MIELLIRAAKNALGVSAAVAIGGTLVPGLLHPERYADTMALLSRVWTDFYSIFVIIFGLWASYYILIEWKNKK